MRALIDGDILRYEIGYAAETAWRGITEDPEELPPFDFVNSILSDRIQHILRETNSDDFTLFLTEGRTFRYDIAKRAPYKGTRVSKKPWHFNNLSAMMKSFGNTRVVKHIEADDAMAIEQGLFNDTIICTRDKDLRQVPGWSYGWELGRQPSFGPIEISETGTMELSEDRKKINGTGFAFFCSQLITGDRVDNIPGLSGIGAVGAFHWLEYSSDSPMSIVETLYQDRYGNTWEAELLEQGQLLWIVRRFNNDGQPELWRLGQWR